MATDNVIRLKPIRPCPICRKSSSQTFHPFCSARCQDIDLNRWLSDAYVIPAMAQEDGDQADSDVGDDED